jgi:hypothetical protein
MTTKNNVTYLSAVYGATVSFTRVKITGRRSVLSVFVVYEGIKGQNIINISCFKYLKYHRIVWVKSTLEGMKFWFKSV